MKTLAAYKDFRARYVRDPLLGHRLGRSFVDSDYRDEQYGTIWLGTNEEGFYGEAGRPLARPHDGQLMLLLGGSTAMGLGATSQEHLLAHKLQDCLVEMTSTPNLRVLNAAVGDYSSWQTLLYFQSELVKLKPSNIVVLDGLNDYVHACWGSKFSKGEWLPNSTRSYDDQLIATLLFFKQIDLWTRLSLRWKFSKLIIWLRSILKSSNNFGKRHHHFVWENCEFWSAKRVALENYIYNKRALTAIADANGISTFHFLQPSLLWGIGKPLAPSELRYLQDLTHRAPKLLTEASIYFSWLSEALETFRKELGDSKSHWRKTHRIWDSTSWFFNVTKELYTDPAHLNDDGQEYLAQLIAEKISGYLPTRQGKSE